MQIEYQLDAHGDKAGVDRRTDMNGVELRVRARESFLAISGVRASAESPLAKVRLLEDLGGVCGV